MYVHSILTTAVQNVLTCDLALGPEAVHGLELSLTELHNVRDSIAL